MEVFPKILAALLLVPLVFTDTVPDNAGTNVAPLLEVCYNDTRLVTRDYRFPTNIATLVEIIRKIEDGSPSINSRELGVQLLQRFRQDGITRTFKAVDSSIGLPYSPRGIEAYKNRVQLKVLTPARTTVNFDEELLSQLEACSLHFMISSSIETQVRGDEGTVCSSIAHYTSRLHKRDVEMAEPFDSGTLTRSSCPVESGVIWTKWGAVKAGLVIAGLAAGLQPNPITTDNGTLETSYASTIAGELSEIALHQTSTIKSVGNKGAWNDTVEPKYYFLEKSERDNLVLTDAEIRGGIDGLVLALGISSWASSFSNLKISQVLDLYYSRGVFNDTTRACNRKALIQNLVQDSTTLVKQTALFNDQLDKESQYGYTPNKANFGTFAQNAVDAFTSYINNNLNDLQCSAENDVIERVATDVLIFIDTAWSYTTIQPLISYVLQSIDVNKFESSYSIFDGHCTPIVNKTRSILDFYDKYNLTEHAKYASGLDYNKVIECAESLFKTKLNNETDLTGQSTIILLLPRTAPSSSQNSLFQTKRNEVFKQYLPDVRIVVGTPGSGSSSSYNDLVNNPTSDIIALPDSDDRTLLRDAGKTIIERFQKLPRSVVNPRCGSSFGTTERTSFENVQYVEPTGINYHKISPHYFYQAGFLKIKLQSTSTIVVCTSRTDANIRANTTGAACDTLATGEVSKDISTYCSDESVSNCPPIYISVEAGYTSSQARCTEKTCRFPDSIKYSIALENVGCNSSATKTIGSLFLVAILFYILRF